MRTYTPLKLPKDTAWDRRSWKRYTPTWFNEMVEGICNIVRWIPVLYKDRDWDDYYITKLLQKKIEHQREYIVKHNRHTRVDYDNQKMTLLLNLLEREHEAYYEQEYMDCITYRRDVLFEVVHEDFDSYLHKYRTTSRKIMAEHKDEEFNAHRIAFYISRHKQEQNRSLIWEVLKRYSEMWWD